MNRKLRFGLFVVGVGTLCMIALITTLNTATGRANVCVGPSGADGCHTTIQAAIDAAGEGETVAVFPGSYAENLVINKTVTLLGGCEDVSCSSQNRGASTIDGLQMDSVIRIGNGARPTIDGFRIINGNATTSDRTGGGIAVREASAVIQYNMIMGNVASKETEQEGRGGGVYVISTTEPVLIYANEISDNVAYAPGPLGPTEGRFGIGGGLFLEATTGSIINNNVIQRNLATAADGDGADTYGGGGGIALVYAGNISLDNNTIVDNTANQAGRTGYGGGLITLRTPVITVTNNLIQQNIALGRGPNGQGGGVYLNSDEHTGVVRFHVANNTVISNTAATNLTFADNTYCAGGGLRLWISTEAEGAELTLTGNRIAGNVALSVLAEDIGLSRIEGGGISVVGFDDAEITENEIMNNLGAAAAAVDAENNAWGGYIEGGGVNIERVLNANVRENVIEENVGIDYWQVTTASTSVSGGGINFTNVVNATASDNRIIRNIGAVRATLVDDPSTFNSFSGGGLHARCWSTENCRFTLTDNEIAENVAVESLEMNGQNRGMEVAGGGAYIGGAVHISVTHNSFIDNRSAMNAQLRQTSNGAFSGGGLATIFNEDEYIGYNNVLSNISVERLELDNANVFPNGGGVTLSSSGMSHVTSNQINANRAALYVNASSGNPGVWPSGGGVSLTCSGEGVICRAGLTENSIADNVAAQELVLADGVDGAAQAGALNVGPQVVANMSANRILRNHSSINGPSEPSAIYTWKGEISSTNDVIAYNSGGISVNTNDDPANLTVRNSTIYHNDEVGVDSLGVAGNISVQNTIVAANKIGLRQQQEGVSFSSDYNVIMNDENYSRVSPGPNTIGDEDPLLLDPAQGDFHLQFGSPAIDRADDAVAPPSDFEGDSRPMDGTGNGIARADIGADEAFFDIEWKYWNYLPIAER